MLDLRILLLALLAGVVFACARDDTATKASITASQPPVSPRSGRGACADDPRVGRVGFPGTPPVLVKRVEPSVERLSPPVQGIVILEVIIDADGQPCSVTVLRSLRRDADEAAVNAVKQWRFIPAKLNGKGWPVAYNVAVNVKRTLVNTRVNH